MLGEGERWRIIHGDCREALPTLGQVDHVITDPPYSEHVHKLQRRIAAAAGSRRASTDRRGHVVRVAELGFAALDDKTRALVASEFFRLVKRWCLVFSDQESQTLWIDDLVIAGMRHVRCGAWVKLCGQPQLSGDRPAVGHEAIEVAHAAKGRCRWNGGGLPAVWAFAIATDRNGTGNRVHTTQKPLDLMLRLVEQFTDPDDLVLDPFCGSGTTGVACLRLGRRFIGIERDEKYAAVARERLEAEERGLTLRDARSGQSSIFDALKENP